MFLELFPSIEESQIQAKVSTFLDPEKKKQENNQHPENNLAALNRLLGLPYPDCRFFIRGLDGSVNEVAPPWKLTAFAPENAFLARGFWGGSSPLIFGWPYFPWNHGGLEDDPIGKGTFQGRTVKTSQGDGSTKLGPRGASNFRGIYLGRSWGWRTYTSNEFGATFKRRISWLKDHISIIIHDIFQVFQDIESVCISQRLNVWSI